MFPKSRLAGENPTGAKPVPDRLTKWGPPTALDESVIAPLMAPIAFGVKVTWIVHVAFGASELGQSLVSEKSPLESTLLMVRFALPLLVSITDCVALGEPPGLATCGAKLKLLTEKCAPGNWGHAASWVNKAKVKTIMECRIQIIVVLPFLQAEDRAAA